METEPMVVIIVAAFSIAGGAAGQALISALANKNKVRAETDSITVDAATSIMSRQQEQITHGDTERTRLEDKISNLQLQVDAITNELREERRRCDTELHSLRLELRAALVRIEERVPPVE